MIIRTSLLLSLIFRLHFILDSKEVTIEFLIFFFQKLLFGLLLGLKLGSKAYIFSADDPIIIFLSGFEEFLFSNPHIVSV